MVEPAMPMQVRASSRGVIFASLQAPSIAASSATAAASSPTFLILMVLPRLEARTRCSSPITHSVLVPPPSMPRKYATELVLSCGPSKTCSVVIKGGDQDKSAVVDAPDVRFTIAFPAMLGDDSHTPPPITTTIKRATNEGHLRTDSAEGSRFRSHSTRD